MKLSFRALYQCLLEDLSEFMPYDVSSHDEAVRQEPSPDLSYKQFSALHMAKSFPKKFLGSTTPSAEQAALDKFIASDNRCHEWSLKLNTSLDEELFGTFKSVLHDFFYPGEDCILSNLNSLARRGEVGPGASIGARGNDFYTKLFSSELTCTSEALYRVYSEFAESDPTWSAAERLRSDHFGSYLLTEGNKLSFVPKNVDTARVICTEPTLNMWVQKGIGSILEDRLRSFFGIDLSKQPYANQEQARIGSSNGSLATLDLSAASDSMSLEMLKSTLPREPFGFLKFCRSPKTTLPDGSVRELGMISSMGNAFTFPLQTIIFASAVSSVYRSLGVPLKRTLWRQSRKNSLGRYPSDRDLESFVAAKRLDSWSMIDDHTADRPIANGLELKQLGNFGVFGDDIIVVTQAYQRLVRLLNILGFSINEEKSFSTGPFRESCGGDFFRGLPCRGVYCRRLDTQESRYVTINRLNRWSAMTGIPLPLTVGLLMKQMGRKLLVPPIENDDAGIWVFTSNLNQSDMPAPSNSGFKYRRWQSRQYALRIGDGEISVPRGAKPRIYNPEGLMKAFLRGDVDNGRINVRHNIVPYHAKWAVVPSWDYLPLHDQYIGETRCLAPKRLAAAIGLNLADWLDRGLVPVA